jgi:uncharacterized membrane protein YbhN (UPF0104 family)
MRIERNRLIWIVSGVLLSATLLALLFSRTSLQQISAAIAGARADLLILYPVLVLITLGLRAYRYGVLVGFNQIGFWPLVLVTQIRNVCVDLLPARLGNAAYLYLLPARYGVPIELGISSLASAVLFDLFCVSPIIIGAAALLLTTATAPPVLIPTVLAAGAAALLAGIVLGALLLSSARWANALASWTAKRAGQTGSAWAARIWTTLQRSLLDMAQLRARGLMLRVLLLSLALRIGKFACLVTIMLAVAAPYLQQSGWAALGVCWITVLLGEVTLTLPLPTLASLGTLEFGLSLGLTTIGGLSAAQAASVSLGVRILSTALQFLVGSLCLILLALGRRRADCEIVPRSGLV